MFDLSFLSVLVLLPVALTFAGAWLQRALLQTFAQAQTGLQMETVEPHFLCLTQVIVAFETKQTQLQSRSLLADLGWMLVLSLVQPQPQQWEL